MLENGRAKAAYDYCKKYEYNQNKMSEYRTRVMNMPFMIKTNGLAGAFVFLLSKGECKPAYLQLYRDIMDWLIKKEMIHEVTVDHVGKEQADAKKLAQLLEMDSLQYRMITMETMALLNWMKRFCDSFYALSKKEKE